jgi:hypothetical protein
MLQPSDFSQIRYLYTHPPSPPPYPKGLLRFLQETRIFRVILHAEAGKAGKKGRAEFNRQRREHEMKTWFMTFLAMGLMLVAGDLYAANGNMTVNGVATVNGGVRVNAPTAYVISSGACPTGDTAVSYRTVANTCSATYSCGDGDTCTGSCTTGYHVWGAGTTAESCTYSSSSSWPSTCTCTAIQLTLCNP